MPLSDFYPHIAGAFEAEFVGDLTLVPQAGSLPFYGPSRVIKANESFDLKVKWKAEGAEVPLRMNAVSNWRVYAYAESIGPGPELALTASPIVVSRGALATSMSWDASVTVPAGTLAEHLPASGLYRIAVVVFADSSLPGVGSDVIGSCEIKAIVLAENPA